MSDDRRLRWFTAYSAWVAVILLTPPWVAEATIAAIAAAQAPRVWRAGMRLATLQLDRRAERSA